MTYSEGHLPAIIEDREPPTPGRKEGRRRFWPGGPWLALAVNLALLVAAAIYHSMVYLPQPAQPHMLTALDDVFALYVALVVALAGLILGRRALRFFPLPDFSALERGALALGLGWGILSLMVLIVGLAHLLYLWVLLVLLGFTLLLGWRDVWRICCLLTSPERYRLFGKIRPVGLLAWGLALLALIEVAMQGSQALTLPYDQPYGYDLYQYHWAVPKLYLLHHAIFGFPGWAHADFPFNGEMLNTLALAVDAPVAALLIQMIFGVLALLLLAGYLYRNVGVLAAWIGVALCLCSPMFTGLLSSGYEELALCFYAVASLVVLLAWLKQANLADAPVSLRLLCLAGLFIGLGLGVKYTEGQVVIGSGALLVGVAALHLLSARRQGKRLWPLARGWLWGILTYGASALLALLPWLVKDWIQLGNPVYPFVWGGPGWDAARTLVGAISLGHFGPQGPLWQRFLLAFWGLFFADQFPGQNYFLPLNYLLLAALLTPLALLLRGRGGRRQERSAFKVPAAHWGGTWLIVAGGGYVAWVLSGATVERYAVSWAILLVVPAASVLAWLCQWAQRVRIARLLAQPGILSVLLVLGPLVSLPFWLVGNPVSLLSAQTSLQNWEQRHIMDPGYWAMVNYVDTKLPTNAKLLLVGRGTGYFIENHDYVDDSGEDWIPYLETEGRTPTGMIALLRQNSFRYLVYEETTLDFVIQNYGNTYLGSFLPQFRQFLADSLTQVWRYQNFAIYQVPPS